MITLVYTIFFVLTQALKQIWDIVTYISFVFHQRSATQVVKPVIENYTEEECRDNDYADDDDYYNKENIPSDDDADSDYKN